jgi:hypothetical protein
MSTALVDPISSQLKSHITSSSIKMEPVARSLAKKLHDKRIKVTVVLQRLSELDGNHDGLVHISDLEEVLIDFLGIEGISRREMEQLARLLANDLYRDRGIVEYGKLADLLNFANVDGDRPPIREQRERVEQWYDPAQFSLGHQTNFERGSVGDWLRNAACPAEAKNFRRFIQCLEEYERISGLKCVPIDNGFTIPFGPDLKANLSFCMNK